MKTAENLTRYPIASDTHENNTFQECLVKVGDKWFMEIRSEQDLYITPLKMDEVFAWLESSKNSPSFKRSIFADKYFSRSWRLENN